MRNTNLARLLGVGIATIMGIGAISAPAQASPDNSNVANGTSNVNPALRLVGGYSAGIAVNTDNPTGLPESAEGYLDVVKTSGTTNSGANFNVRPTAVGLVNQKVSERRDTVAGSADELSVGIGYANLATPVKTKLDTQLPVGDLKPACTYKKPGSWGTTIWVGDLAKHSVSVKTNCITTSIRGKVKNTVINTGYINGKAFSRLDAGATVVIKNGWVNVKPAPGKAQSTQVWATDELAVTTHRYTLEGHRSGSITGVSGWVELPVQKYNTLQSGRNAKLTRDQHFGHLKLGA